MCTKAVTQRNCTTCACMICCAGCRKTKKKEPKSRLFFVFYRLSKMQIHFSDVVDTSEMGKKIVDLALPTGSMSHIMGGGKKC